MPERKAYLKGYNQENLLFLSTQLEARRQFRL